MSPFLCKERSGTLLTSSSTALLGSRDSFRPRHVEPAAGSQEWSDVKFIVWGLGVRVCTCSHP